MQKQKALQVKNITKIYKIYKNNFDRIKEALTNKIYHKEFIANDNISFDLLKGETLGIIGINGAGKSTVLKIISGVIEPTSGKIIKNGRVVALLELGTGFNMELNGYENIFLNATMIGMSKDETKENLQNIIEFSELGEYIYEPVKTYSSGMIMRLAFSIAIFAKPDILIVDEALSVGDAHFSAKCTKALKEKKSENLSIIYVSHDLNSLKILCDRILLLNHGKIVAEGNPEDVINLYNQLIAKLNNKNNIVTNLKNSDSFGTFDAEIQKVSIVGKNSKSNIISSGENAIITLKIKSNKDIKDVNIGFTIRDKFGQDIYGVNTYFMGKLFDLEENKIYNISFNLKLDIGVGKYTISVALAKGENHLEKCFHWLDYATDFEIAGNIGEMFIGVAKLYPKISNIEEL